ncbi:Uncharacterised protein [Vibrio cholerae]|nr:Uncharacterised protein [Vibrio cholerae]
MSTVGAPQDRLLAKQYHWLKSLDFALASLVH